MTGGYEMVTYWIKGISLFVLLTVMVFLSTPALCTENYAGMYFVYPDEDNKMWVLFETDTGVNDDYNHRRLHFEYDSWCNEPNWKYEHSDYDFWPDEWDVDYSGIPGKENRRLWMMEASNLTPGCHYDVRFSYRDTDPGTWEENWGHFYAPPERKVEANPTLQFYAFGDSKYYDDTEDNINKVAEAAVNHSGMKTFILHTGDIVYDGGGPVGKYYYHYSDGSGWYIHDNDKWYQYFSLSHVQALLCRMPMLPALGNHDFDLIAKDGKYYYYGNPAKLIKAIWANTYNYRHYFPWFYRQGHALEDQYYKLAYGQTLICSLTSFPMDDGSYCSKTNRNYRPKDLGGTGQYDWLEKTLAEAPQQWRIVQMHAPLYSPDDCDNQEEGRTYLTPLFETYGVDLVIAGHEHYYSRKTVNGIPYLILGGAGAGLSLEGECVTNPQCKGYDMVQNEHHFGFFHIVGDVMRASIMSKIGEKFDQFIIDRTPRTNFIGDGSGLTVSFTDQSTGHVTGWAWDFTSDGIVDSTLKDPDYTYEKSGTYHVTLKALSAWGISSIYKRTISVPLGQDNHPAPVCKTAWTDPVNVPGWFGDNSEGGGMAAADINANGMVDLIIFHIDHPSDGNRGYYRIGWDIATDGTVSSWTDPVNVPGWFGGNNQGAGLAAADINANGMVDLIIFHIDHPSDGNHGYYRIGWDVDTAGNVLSWTDPIRVMAPNGESGWFGNENQGGGIAAADMDGNGVPDLMVFHIDNPDGSNAGYYRIGWNPDNAGQIHSWTEQYPIPVWWGNDNAFGGLDVADIDANGFPEVIAFHIDHPSGGNQGYYRIEWDIQGDGSVCSTCADAQKLPRPRHR